MPCRRWFSFDANDLTLKYYDRENPPSGTTPKGAFAMSAAHLFATRCQDHGRNYEIKITSKDQTLFAAAENDEAADSLLAKIDIARRLKIAGDDGKELVPVDVAARAAADMTQPGEPGVKVFSWGVGSMLASNSPAVQGMAFPQRVFGFKSP